MDKRTKEALAVIATIQETGDAVYEVFKSKKRSVGFHLLDTVLDVIPSVADTLTNRKVMYLLASDKKAQLIHVQEGMIVSLLDVPDWSQVDKENFQKITIDGFLYKKFKRLV